MKAKNVHIYLLLICFLTQGCNLVDSAEVLVELCLLPEYVFPEMCLLYDKISKSFVSMVSLVASMVFIYSYSYMKGVVMETKFYLLLGLFSLSMLFLSLSASAFWLMVGWDGLGFSSFCLIIFYQNWKGVSGGLVTFLSNRFGDLFIMCGISCMFLMDWWDKPCSSLGCVVLLLCLGSMSKSAQMPFSAWLPMAMAAPTPVSSLVHSSTLVTAGVFILSRFSSLMEPVGMKFMYFVSSLTILVAGSSSMMEWDLKKVVALSTLSHIGLMINMLSIGSLYPALWHMQFHAFFKSLLFMGAGVIIHLSSSWQDLRRVSWAQGSLDWFLVVIATLSMAGAPFLAGFYSKEMMMLSTGGLSSVLSSLPFWLGVMFTIGYSIRILVHVLVNGRSLCYASSVFSPFTLLFGGVFSCFGGVMMWLSMDLCFEVVHYNTISLKLLVLMVVLGTLSGALSVFCQEFVINLTLPSLFWKSNSYVYFFSENFFKMSWKNLYICDTKGYLDSLISKLVFLIYMGFNVLLACVMTFSRIGLIIILSNSVILLIYLL